MTDEWLEVMRVAHRVGLSSTATMMFGHIETLAERIEHLERLRQLQDETGGFTAFICWTFQPEHTEMADIPPAGAYDLVLCRNTVIYFNEDVRDALHARLADALRPGGVLVVGATERVTAPEAIGLQATAPFTYVKGA